MKLNYREYGTGKTIYFIHGLALDATSMEYIYEPVFKNNMSYRRVYIDLPGMGETKISPDIKTSDEILELLQTFLVKDSKNKEIIVCGHSYGGYLSLALTYLLPKRINKLFVTCPVVIANSENRITETHKNIITEEIKLVSNKDYFNDYLSMNTLINNSSWLDYQLSIIPGLEMFDKNSWNKIQNTSYELSFENCLFKNLPKINGTVLLGEFDHIVGYKNQYNLLSTKIEDIVIVPNSGHNLPIDIRNEVEDIFLHFLTTNCQ